MFSSIIPPRQLTMQVTAVVPYEVAGSTTQVAVTYQGKTSTPLSKPVAASAPSLLTANQTGAGLALAVNVSDGNVNSAADPVKIGDYITNYATDEGQTVPAGVDGAVMGSSGSRPALSVSARAGGIPAVRKPGGYLPVVVQVGTASSKTDAILIAVSGE